jgi:hypothetical protein
MLLIGLFHLVEETHGSLERKPSCYKQEHVVQCFPVRMELVFQGMIPASWEFPCGDRLSLFHILLFS